MSRLLDRWNEELAKLQAKGRGYLSSATASSNPRVEPDSSSSSSSSVGLQVLSQAVRIKHLLAAPLPSETALSILVDLNGP